MIELVYFNENIQLFFSWLTMEFYKETSEAKCDKISYQDFIMEIERVPDKSSEWKYNTITLYGKKAGILEVA